MFNFLEKFFFKRILKKIAKLIPYGQDRIKELWEQNKDEMVEKAKEAIEKAIKDVIKRALEKQGIHIVDSTDV